MTLEDAHRLLKSRDAGLLSGTAARAEELRTERAADAYQEGRRSVSANAVGARGTASPVGMRRGI
jgi:hypothetical protein